MGGRVVNTMVLLTGGAIGAAVLTAVALPAGTLVGSVAGSAIANQFRRAGAGRRPLPAPFRVVGLVLLGCASGVSLDAHTLGILGRMAVPLLAGILMLLAVNAALAALLVRRYGVDSLTAVLACAAGGVSEIAVTASKLGARIGVVLAIHTVRVLTVVLVLLPLLVLLMDSP